MATEHTIETGSRTRYRLIEIKLDPTKSEYDVTVKLIVDGKTIHKLRDLKKGQTLFWDDLRLPLDLEQPSTVIIQVIEDRTFRKVISQASCRAVDWASKDVISGKCDREGYTVEIRLMDKQMAELAYVNAVSKAEQMGTRLASDGRGRRIVEAFGKLLKLGTLMTDQDPTGGGKAAFLACTKAWEHMEELGDREAMLDELVQSLAGMVPVIELVKGLADHELKRTVVAMLELIEDASLFIVAYRSESLLKRAVRSVKDSSDQTQIERFKTTFERLRRDFDTRVGVQLLQEARVAKIDKALETIKLIDQAGYDSTDGCLFGTRTDAIDQIVGWAIGRDTGSRLAWICGRAGLGKSSVASSVCCLLDQRGVLASSFFCKRDKDELRDPRNVLKTIVRGLARRWEAYRGALATVIEEDPEVVTKRVQPMFDSLLVRPVNNLVNAERPGIDVVFVVDALDQCGDDATRKQLLVCLRAISQLVPEATVLVAGRSNPDIREFFESPNTSHRAFDLEEYDAADDIRAYVYNYLSQLQTIKGWPKDGAEQIWTRSARLFIYARTACRFIVNGYEPVERLNLVLAEKSWGDIDALYTTTLRAALQGDEADNAEYMRLFLGAVVTTASCAPLSAGHLTALLRRNVPTHRLNQLLHSFSSVLYDDQRLNGAVRISHPSFVDYITSEARSNGLCVDTKLYNTLIARLCFDVMHEYLCFNMCGLQTSGVFNSDVPNLAERVREGIAPHVAYSCRYWSYHAIQAGTSDVWDALETFLSSPTLLYWLEALSLLGELRIASTSLARVAGCTDTMLNENCRTLAEDAYRFVLAFYDPISQSTPHLYLSALAFAPKGSEISRRMRTEFSRLAVTTENTETQWPACMRTVSALGVIRLASSPKDHRIALGCVDGMVRVLDAVTGDVVLGPLLGHSQPVHSVAYSPDGSHIATGSVDSTVRIWDSETGKAVIEPIQAHPLGVSCIAYSPDGCRIASCSTSADKTVRIWDTATGGAVSELLVDDPGQLPCLAYSPREHRVAIGSNNGSVYIWDTKTEVSVLGPLKWHFSTVQSMSYSPDGRCIASGSADGTIGVWDAQTGLAVLDPIQALSNWILSVAYSPDGRYIASGCADHMVLVWDTKTGKLSQESFQGHTSPVWSVAYSPDGKRITSCSSDRAVRIWNANVGKARAQPLPEAPPANRYESHFVAYSPDGRHIATGPSVHIWDAETAKTVVGPLEGHSGTVLTAAYSPDGRHIASGSVDHTVGVWCTLTGEARFKPMQGHSGPVNRVAYSSDSRRIVSGSEDKTLRVWDATTGKLVLEPLRGHSAFISSVAFSPSGHHIASGSWDSTVRVWDAKSGEQVLELPHGGKWVLSMSYAPDGNRIAAGAGATLHVWDVVSGTAVFQPVQHQQELSALAYSPDDRYLASGTQDGALRVRDAATGDVVLGPLQSPVPQFSCIAYSPDGRRIASGSYRSTACIWDMEPNATELNIIPGQVQFSPMYSAVYSPKGCSFCPDTPSCKLRTRSGQGTILPSGACAPFIHSENRVPVIPHRFSGGRMLLSSSQLARHIDPAHSGWVITPDHQLLFWLPPELRAIDDSLTRIDRYGIHHQIMVDMSDFVHGAEWLSIVGHR